MIYKRVLSSITAKRKVRLSFGCSFLKDDRFSLGSVNMAKIYEGLLSTNILREKRPDSFDPQRENLLGEDSICMVNLQGTPRAIVFFFLLHD